MNKYIYARLFVRATKLIALIAFVGGFFIIFKNAYLTKSELDTKVFNISPECNSLASSIEKCYSNTQKVVLASLDQSQFEPSSNVRILDTAERINQINGLSESERPNAYCTLARDLSDSSKQIKEYHKRELYECIEKLRKSLLQHAATLKGQLNLPTSSSTSNVQAANNILEGVTTFRFFGDTSDDSRSELLNRVNDRLVAIQQESTRTENIEAATRAIKDISNLSKLLLFDKVVSSQNQNLTTVSNEPTAPLINAEKLAQKLLDDENEINNLFYDNWVLDNKTQKLNSESNSELKRRDDLNRERISILISFFTNSIMIIIMALSLSFFLLVLSDLITAFLNMSNNTDIFKAYALNTDDDCYDSK